MDCCLKSSAKHKKTGPCGLPQPKVVADSRLPTGSLDHIASIQGVKYAGQV